MHYSRVGADAFNSISQSSMSRFIDRITDIIVTHLASKFIRFPQTPIEIHETKARFEEKYGLPGVLGVIDGTHVALAALKNDIEHAFVNRKGFHSINVQVACDDRLLFANINARFPGDTHDSYIFLGSELHRFLRDLYRQDPNEVNFIIGNKYSPYYFY